MKKGLAIFGAIIVLAISAFIFPERAESAGVIREYTLIVTEQSVEFMLGRNFTAWVYNGSIPGPILRANVGDTVKVTLVNKATLAHSIHVHGFEYSVTDDGSQSPNSTPSMVPPGKSYTYTFQATRPGFYPYHCHSNDKYGISVHVQQGLQGGIIVDDGTLVNNPAKEYFVILNEVYDKPVLSLGHGCSYCAMNSKYFALNSKQFPLPQARNLQTGAIEHPTARTGEKVRFYVLNLGNDIHTFHIHGHDIRKRSPSTFSTTDIVDGDNKAVLTAEAFIFETTARTPGYWLYHCHMDVHADLGMMGTFRVTP